MGNERRKEDETRWKGHATHLPTSIYCDRADYICGRRYIRGESPFNWPPRRQSITLFPIPLFLSRICGSQVIRANHSIGIIVLSSRGNFSTRNLFPSKKLESSSFDQRGKEKEKWMDGRKFVYLKCVKRSEKFHCVSSAFQYSSHNFHARI